MTFEIVKPTKAQATALSLNMRPEDSAEIWKLERISPLKAVLQSMETSLEAYTILVEGKVAGMFGIAPVALVGQTMIPWMLTTGEIEKIKKSFVKETKRVVREWSRTYHLINYIDADYTKALAWARHCGFTVHPPQEVNGGTFCLIEAKKWDT
jgi:hypothetical protein